MRSGARVSAVGTVSVVVGVVGALAVGGTAGAVADEGRDGFTVEDPRIVESSGLAASRAHPGVYWTHNDSDDGPYLYAVDGESGETVATVTLRGIGEPRDVEAISIGPDGDLYVGDIGDNQGGAWPHVWIYRLPEPKELRDVTVTATQYVVQYEGGARDAESLMVHPKTGRVYIADKKKQGGGLFAGPEKLSASGTNTFRRVSDVDLWATDGAFSPDGERLVLRGYFKARSYAWRDGGISGGGEPLSLPFQRQGESVTFTPDGGTLLYGSEGERSRVRAVPVEGKENPAASGGGAEQDEGGSAGARGEDGEDGDSPSFALGAVVLAVAFGVTFGLKRLLRRK
ncbi:TolB-like translocation protein [Streptomyces sp. O3]